MRYQLSILLAILLYVPLAAHTQAVQVLRIEIQGIAKTKEVTVLRELDFTAGDTLTQTTLTERFERNRDNLLNTALFTDVEINISEWNTEAQQITVLISVKEAWYLYIVPILELADRNFNVWVQEHNAAFNRVNLGVRIIHINLSGSRDRLKFKAQFGYTKKFEAKYQVPYFNREKTLGGHIKATWSANKEVVYLNQGNKEVFYRDENNDVLRRFQIQAGLQFRPNLYFTQDVELSFYNNWINGQIALDNNPDFFLQSKSIQNYFSLRYRAILDKRDLQLLPTQGPRVGVEILKEGMGLGDINTLSIAPLGEYNFALSGRLSAGVLAKCRYGIIRSQPPFHNYLGLGYGGDLIRGYELYVLNGLDYIYAKTGIKMRVAEARINWKRKLPKAFRDMDIQLFVSANFDAGYVNDPFYAEGNPYVNKTIYGGGPAMSLMLYHTFVFHFEYNFNDAGENGLFLRTMTSF